MDIYKQGSRENITVSTERGVLTMSQLWSTPRSILVSAEEALEVIVNKLEQTSRRRRVLRSKEDKLMELRLAIVSDILDTREKEEESLAIKAANKIHNDEIDALILEKKGLAKKSLSIEELEKLRK